MKNLIGLHQVIFCVLLIGSGLIFAQPNTAIPYTMGSGCVTVEVSPVSGTVLTVSTANSISLTFNQNVEYFRATNYRKLLSAYSAAGPDTYATLLTDLNTATTGKPAAVYLVNAATGDVFKPNSATNSGRGDFLRVTFNANTLPNNAFLQLFIANRFMDGNYQNYLMEYLGYMNYTTGTGVSVGNVAVPPRPSFCPATPSLPATPVISNTNPSIVNVVGSLCTSMVAGLPCNWTLTAQIDFSGVSPFNHTLTSFVDDTGDSYSLKFPLKITAVKSSTELKLPMTLHRIYTPNLEHVDGNVASSTLLDSVFDEVPSHYVQPFFDLLPSGATLYLSHVGRNWQEGDLTDANAILESTIATNSNYAGIFTLTSNGTQISVRCTEVLRSSYRWRIATLTPRQGRACTKGSSRNAFCPNLSQIPYGAYDVNATPESAELLYPLAVSLKYATTDDDVLFSDRPSEIALGRVFAANVTLPAVSSLNQGNALSTRRLLLPDLETTPSPANYLWRLVPLTYFGGGCDTLDASMTDFYNQPDFCSQPYGSCMNYQLSYWMKDTSISTLPAVINNFGSLFGTVDGTKERMRIESTKLVMSYNPATERVKATININAQRGGLEILEPMIGAWAIDKKVVGQLYQLVLTVTNDGDGPGLFTFGGVCPESISIDGAAQTVPAGSSLNLTILIDATATAVTGNYSCSLFISIPQQKLWSTSNKYVTSLMDFSLENGCTDSSVVTALGQPFLVYGEAVWRVNPNPFAAQQDPFSIKPLTWGSASGNPNNLTVLVSASVKNGGNLQGEFTVAVDECEISTGDQAISIFGSSVKVLIDPEVTETVQVPVLYIGAPGLRNVSITCSWRVTVTRATCWSSKGKQFAQSITMPAPYDYCLDYSDEDIAARESYLLREKDWWAQHESVPDLSAMNLIGWTQLEWATSDQITFTKFVVAQIYNSGPMSANFTADLVCSDDSLTITSTPQAECTNLASQSNCTATVTIRSDTSYLSAQTLTCTLTASMYQRYGDESYCWSSLGKQYAQEISLLYPLLLTTQPGGENNNLGGIFGIGEGASIGVLILIIVVAAAAVVVPVVVVQVKKMNAQKSAADEFEGFEEDEAAKQRKMITQSTLPSAQMDHELQTTP